MKLKLIALASDGLPGETVVALTVLFVTLTTGVPVTTSPVTTAVPQTNPDVSLTVMLPEPKAIVRELELLDENLVAVSAKSLRFKVPLVRKNWNDEL